MTFLEYFYQMSVDSFPWGKIRPTMLLCWYFKYSCLPHLHHHLVDKALIAIIRKIDLIWAYYRCADQSSTALFRLQTEIIYCVSYTIFLWSSQISPFCLQSSKPNQLSNATREHMILESECRWLEQGSRMCCYYCVNWFGKFWVSLV